MSLPHSGVDIPVVFNVGGATFSPGLMLTKQCCSLVRSRTVVLHLCGVSWLNCLELTV